MISLNHPNRQAHNWLVYDVTDRFLSAHVGLYRGALYDFGSGDQAYREFFLRYADSYVAVDWAKNIHNVRPDIVADLNETLPINSGSADTIISLSVLEHLSDPHAMLAEAYRVLKPGGAIVLHVPWQWHIHEAPYDFFRFSPFAMDLLLSRAGFVDIKIEPSSGFFTTIVTKLNYFSLRAIRGPRLARIIIRALLRVGWFTGQKLAPLFDRLDGNWAHETLMLEVTARKGDH